MYYEFERKLEYIEDYRKISYKGYLGCICKSCGEPIMFKVRHELYAECSNISTPDFMDTDSLYYNVSCPNCNETHGYCYSYSEQELYNPNVTDALSVLKRKGYKSKGVFENYFDEHTCKDFISYITFDDDEFEYIRAYPLQGWETREDGIEIVIGLNKQDVKSMNEQQLSHMYNALYMWAVSLPNINQLKPEMEYLHYISDDGEKEELSAEECLDRSIRLIRGTPFLNREVYDEDMPCNVKGCPIGIRMQCNGCGDQLAYEETYRNELKGLELEESGNNTDTCSFDTDE